MLVTRPADQAGTLGDLLRASGARVLIHPVIEIRALADMSAVDEAIAQLRQFGTLVFASSNGVRFFLNRCLEQNLHLANFEHLEIAAIGNGTAAEVKSAGLNVQILPDRSNSEGVADALIHKASNQSTLLIRASRGSDVLPNRLTEAGIPFRQIAVYESVDVPTVERSIVQALDDQAIDWVTITSSAIARSAVRLFGERLLSTKLASISPTTSQQLVLLGFPPTAEATEYDMVGLVRAIERI